MPNPQQRILIIDDSPSDRKIYRRFLGSDAHGEFEVVEAATVGEGIDRIRNVEPDCILLDYQLPDRDGISALEEIRGLSAAPVILITGKPEALLITEAYRRGVTRYISKDMVSSQSLLEAVHDAMNLS